MNPAQNGAGPVPAQGCPGRCQGTELGLTAVFDLPEV
jgi:hypothetical protein